VTAEWAYFFSEAKGTSLKRKITFKGQNNTKAYHLKEKEMMKSAFSSDPIDP